MRGHVALCRCTSGPTWDYDEENTTTELRALPRDCKFCKIKLLRRADAYISRGALFSRSQARILYLTESGDKQQVFGLDTVATPAC